MGIWWLFGQRTWLSQGSWFQTYRSVAPVLLPVDVSGPERRARQGAGVSGYGFLITKCSKSFCWPLWVLYDQEFRQTRAGERSCRWDEINVCLYTPVCLLAGWRRERTGAPSAIIRITPAEAVQCSRVPRGPLGRM